MTNYINYKSGQITINACRAPEAIVATLEDLLAAIDSGSDEALTVVMSGVLDALEDGQYLSTIDASMHAIEELHGEIVAASKTTG